MLMYFLVMLVTKQGVEQKPRGTCLRRRRGLDEEALKIIFEVFYNSSGVCMCWYDCSVCFLCLLEEKGEREGELSRVMYIFVTDGEANYYFYLYLRFY